MKKISNPRIIACVLYAVLCLVQIGWMYLYNEPSLFWFYGINWISLIVLTVVVYYLDNRSSKKERKKRDRLMFDESAHWHDEPLGKKIQISTLEEFNSQYK